MKSFIIEKKNNLSILVSFLLFISLLRQTDCLNIFQTFHNSIKKHYIRRIPINLALNANQAQYSSFPFDPSQFSRSSDDSNGDVDDQIVEEDLTKELEQLEQQIFSTSAPTIDNISNKPSIDEPISKLKTEMSSIAAVPKKSRVLLARLVAWILHKVVKSQTRQTTGLLVQVDAASNRDILRGRVNNIELLFDTIAYGQLCISGGGRLNIQGIQLQMRRFLFSDVFNSLRTPYKLSGDLLLTEADIVNSKFIRDLMQVRK